MPQNKISKEAKSRIEAERINKTGILDLSKCKLQFIPREIGALTWLNKLSLSSNQLKKIEGLETLNGLTKLDLHSNQLNKIEGLETLTALNTLFLSSNQLKKIEGLETLNGLTKLDLYSNQLKKIEGLEKLTALNTLDLSNNKLMKIEGLETLTALNTLDIFSNQLTKIEGFETLITLNTLDLSYNELTKIEGLETLTALNTLDLSYNGLTKIEGLETLTALNSLSLSYNELTKIEGLEKLTALNTLYLSFNELNKIEGLEKLTALSSLDLTFNHLNKIEGLEKLTALNTLYLSNNQIEKIENLDNLISLSKIILDNNPIQNYPGEIPQDYKSIKAYFDDHEKLTNKSVKINILGEGRIGKTQLFNYLSNKGYKEDAEATHGTNKDFYKRINDYQISLWDFGGQTYHHGFHNLFIGKDDINIVLWINNLQKKDEFRYWLGTAREAELLKKDDIYKNPILLVQNVWDQNQDDDERNQSVYPSSDIIEKYQLAIDDVHLINVKELFLKNDSWSTKHSNFIETLNAKIRSHASKQVELRKRWIEVKTQLDNQPINQIALTIDEFRKKYANDLDDNYFTGLLNYLQYTGNIIQILDSETLKGYIFADPPFLSDWLFNTILDKKFQESNKPEISRNILLAKNITKRDVDIFFDLMTYYELIFQKPNFKEKDSDQRQSQSEDEIYIIPQFLPEFNHSFKNILLELLPFTFSLRFPDFFHESKIFNFFSIYGEYAENETSYWKYGLLYKHPLKNAMHLKTLMYFKREDRQIFFHIENKKGISEVAQELFDYFVFNQVKISDTSKKYRLHDIDKISLESQIVQNYKKFEKVINEEPPLNIRSMKKNFRASGEIRKDDVHIVTQLPYYFDVHETSENIKANNYFGQCIKTNKRVKLDYMSINLLDKQNKKKYRIFFSYSHKDEKYRDELEVHMAMLKRSGSIETWHDRKILAAENWDDKIKEQLLQADIVLLMLSPDFLHSDYIWEQELGILKQRKDSNDGVKIIPVFTRPCDTTGLEWMDHQGLQKDHQSKLPWISSTHDRDELYLEMIKEVRKIL